MNTKDREAFEAWWVTFDIKPDLSELDKDSEGYYIDLTTQRMWQAWKAARAQDEWISVDLAIPTPYLGIKKFECKLVKGSADPKEVIEVRAVMHKDWQRLSFGDWVNVTHWKPLPEPPKEQDDV